jgi:hypothetical protein
MRIPQRPTQWGAKLAYTATLGAFGISKEHYLIAFSKYCVNYIIFPVNLLFNSRSNTSANLTLATLTSAAYASTAKIGIMSKIRMQ